MFHGSIPVYSWRGWDAVTLYQGRIAP
jgi:hypothetical protein